MADQPKGPKNQLVALISAAIIGAIPGGYAAWETARQEWRQKRERKVRDTAEKGLHKLVQANKAELDALRDACVTHKDLLEVILKIRNAGAFPAPYPPGHKTGRSSPTKDLSLRLRLLREKVLQARLARERAKAARNGAPTLQTSGSLRKQLDPPRTSPPKHR